MLSITHANLHNRIGKEIGVSPETILKTSHGRRSIDVLKILAPERANWECTYSYSFIHHEHLIPYNYVGTSFYINLLTYTLRP